MQDRSGDPGPPTRPSRAVLQDWVRALAAMQRQRDDPTRILATIVADAAVTQGGRPALIGTDEHFTYADLAAQSNRYARWALAQDLGPGDCVALLMQNRPDYIAIWLGLTQVGCVVALLNTNLAADGLAHCLRAAAAQHVIAEAALLGPAPPSHWWVHGEYQGGQRRIDQAVAQFSGVPLGAGEQRPPAARDHALLIYTSGTTGLPKAAYVSHARIMAWSGWFAAMLDAQPDDRLYDCLPLYHSVGGVVAVGSMLVAGGSVVIRKRFSASRFWDDVTGTGCTIVQYIGELCRYLLQAPPQPHAAAHAIRAFCGNGLRGEVWRPFQQRFHVPRILEFYAATEGSVSLYNAEGQPGAIGRVPPFLAHRFPVALIRCDPTGQPLRDAAGRCLRCAPDEPGEAIGPVEGEAGAPLRRFDGYTDPDASARKLLHGVFEPGDCWFRSGDLMRKDAAGYYYFVDRLGDTFRWKGENVSTTEVAAVLAGAPGVIEAVVYGVPVPGAEGKAGMAALVVAAGFDLATARAHWCAHLPRYARPLFVRLCPAIATTGTFKLTTIALAREGLTAPDIWFDDPETGGFVPCDAALVGRIEAGAVRL
jgi:fatty-acyl-CoA synthase